MSQNDTPDTRPLGNPLRRRGHDDYPDTTYGQTTATPPTSSGRFPASASAALIEAHAVRRIAAWLEGQGPIGHALAAAVRAGVWR
jgi:hypothetical protein